MKSLEKEAITLLSFVLGHQLSAFSQDICFTTNPAASFQ
jgi:hypothetical protein